MCGCVYVYICIHTLWLWAPFLLLGKRRFRKGLHYCCYYWGGGGGGVHVLKCFTLLDYFQFTTSTRKRNNLSEPLQQQPLVPNCIFVPGACVPVCGLPLRSAFSWRVPCCWPEISRTPYMVSLEFLSFFFASKDKHGHVWRNENKILKPSMMVKWWLHWNQEKQVAGSSQVFAIALPPLALALVAMCCGFFDEVENSRSWGLFYWVRYSW